MINNITFYSRIECTFGFSNFGFGSQALSQTRALAVALGFIETTFANMCGAVVVIPSAELFSYDSHRRQIYAWHFQNWLNLTN